MNRKVIIFLVFVFCVITFACASASNNQNDCCFEYQKNSSIYETSRQIVKLPESLLVVDDEAFEGTSITYIILPETVKTIGDRAFANISTLLSIRIPLATNIIASTAFAGSKNVTIDAAPNSYARKYAKAQGLPFSPIATFSKIDTSNVNINITGSTHSTTDKSSENTELEKQWRILEEINVVRIFDIIFKDVQGRGPPMGEVKF